MKTEVKEFLVEILIHGGVGLEDGLNFWNKILGLRYKRVKLGLKLRICSFQDLNLLFKAFRVRD